MLSDEQKKLINDAVSRVAKELAQEGAKDLYVLQDYLGDFDCDSRGVVYPDHSSVSMKELQNSQELEEVAPCPYRQDMYDDNSPCSKNCDEEGRRDCAADI